ncbi:MAG: FecR domain-containing protein [Flavobacteriales bacterium]|nr:FecR domain-containing protein [Flavobacteriales bacterium]MCB9168006.1 FecR domain-containing protein [Flavobacteriales bacterium]
MNGKGEIASEQLARFVAGEADPATTTAVERWAASHPDNALELQRMQVLWSLGADGEDAPEVDVDKAWATLSARMRTGRGRVIGMRRILPWAAAAAVLTGVFFAVRLLIAPATDRFAAIDASLDTLLPDSSRMVLAEGSQATARIGRTREVEVQGKVYFEVAHDAEHPFVVHAQDMEVTVLGTMFEVTAYDTSDLREVRVRTGRVRVVVPKDTVVLIAGETARYGRTTGMLEHMRSASFQRWGERILQFDDAPLEQVVEQLSILYSVHVALASPELGRCRLTATFADEPIDAVLQVIANTFGMRVEHRPDGSFLLDGDGC